MPIFSKGSGGIAHFATSTGGYLFGYLLATIVIPLILGKKKDDLKWQIIAVTTGMLSMYVTGFPWFKIVLGDKMSMSNAILKWTLPFTAIDLIKIAAAILLARTLRPVLDRE